MTLEELAGKLRQIKVEVDNLLICLGDGITGEIRYAPPPPPIKIKRKRRTKKEIGAIIRFATDLIPPPTGPLPDADTGNTFYTKKKREKKESTEG